MGCCSKQGSIQSRSLLENNYAQERFQQNSREFSDTYMHVTCLASTNPPQSISGLDEKVALVENGQKNCTNIATISVDI